MEQYDKDYLKMAILKQEATFKQQVHELHRVYGVQQFLMREMKSTKTTAEEVIGRHALAFQESDLELTLATGSSRRQKKKETSSCSDSGSSFSSSSAGSEAVQRNSNEPGIDIRFNHESRSRFNFHDKRRQEGINQTSWFSQCLSLKLT